MSSQTHVKHTKRSLIFWTPLYVQACRVYVCGYSKPSHAFAYLYQSTHAATSTAKGDCASAERERPTAPQQPTLYLQAAVASGYWSVIKSLGPPQGQFISEVITPELYMTASVNHKCWISSLCTRNDVQKRWKAGEEEEGERETSTSNPPLTIKTSAGWNGLCATYIQQMDCRQTEVKSYA